MTTLNTLAEKFSSVSKFLWDRVDRPRMLLASLSLSIMFVIVSSIHFLEIYENNPLMVPSWLFSVIFLIAAFTPHHSIEIERSKSFEKKTLFLFIAISALYWITHLFNFSNAPWNTFGLFDDAAWDIFFSKDRANFAPFQVAFFDDIGRINRETLFHYYITIFFKLLGYNLLAFNISLLVLGFVTVLFTSLVIHELFKNNYVTTISALILNFLPFHFLHVFRGDRYAIAAPLMVVSLYFLYLGLQKAQFKVPMLIAGVFAGLSLSATVMGKQYLVALLASAIVFIILKTKQALALENIKRAGMFLLGLVVTSLPLLVYIYFFEGLYYIREKGLMNEFTNSFKASGWKGIDTYYQYMIDVLFAPHSGRRFFLPDHVIIPSGYFFSVLLGGIIAFLKKRYEIILLVLMPAAGAFIAGFYDFRVLHAVPAIIVIMAFSIDWLFRKSETKGGAYLKFGTGTGLVICILLGLIPSISYLYKVSSTPNYIWLLPHKDVAVSRIFQDIAACNDDPSPQMKPDEFNRKVDPQRECDIFVSPTSSYAIAHLYLKDFDDKAILEFNDQGTQNLMTEEALFHQNVKTIKEYEPRNKDLKLVWQVSNKSRPVISKFDPLSRFGYSFRISGEVDGIKYEVYVLTIPRHNVVPFKEAVNALEL